MLSFKRHMKILLATAAAAIAIPMAASVGQPAAPADKVATTPQPPPPDMPPLTPEETLARQSRGGGGRGGPAPNYNVSRRSDFDKAGGTFNRASLQLGRKPSF